MMFGWMRKTWYANDNDAWNELQALGYTMESFTDNFDANCQRKEKSSGKKRYALFRYGVQVNAWSGEVTVDQSYRLRREWALKELERLKEDGELTD